jgi:hypothetical protein
MNIIRQASPIVTATSARYKMQSLTNLSAKNMTSTSVNAARASRKRLQELKQDKERTLKKRTDMYEKNLKGHGK